MGKKCCVPGCRSGYKGIDMTEITMHKFEERWKDYIRRGGKWQVTGNTHICSTHFVESDFKNTTCDQNVTRKRQKGTGALAYRCCINCLSLFSMLLRYFNKT